jgi:hypothetical protein
MSELKTYHDMIDAENPIDSDRWVFSVLDRYGPRDETELNQQTFSYYRLVQLYVIAMLHAALITGSILALEYALNMSELLISSEIFLGIIKIVAIFIFIWAMYYTFYGGAPFQARIFFRDRSLISSYRKLSFTKPYPLYAALGFTIGITLAFLLSKKPGVLLPDLASSRQSTILIFGLTNLIASMSCALRAFLKEEENKYVVLEWIKKRETYKRATNR